jgi:hypothetical protein
MYNFEKYILEHTNVAFDMFYNYFAGDNSSCYECPARTMCDKYLNSSCKETFYEWSYSKEENENA